MGKANRNIPVIDDRPMTSERLEAMHQKWLSREDDTEPWDKESSNASNDRKTNRIAG